MDIEAKIREKLGEILERDGQTIELDASFTKDMGMDSLRALEIFAALENEFSIVISPERLPEMLTLRGVIKVASEYIANSGK